MSDEYWDGNEEEQEEMFDYNDEVSGPFIRVNGSNIDVEEGASFKDTVKATAMDAGLGKFRVFLNGEEVKPSEAPDVFDENTRVELRQYDVAG